MSLKSKSKNSRNCYFLEIEYLCQTSFYCTKTLNERAIYRQLVSTDFCICAATDLSSKDIDNDVILRCLVIWVSLL